MVSSLGPFGNIRTGSQVQEHYLDDLDPHRVIVGIASLIESEAHGFVPVDGNTVQIMICQGQPDLKGCRKKMGKAEYPAVTRKVGLHPGRVRNCSETRASSRIRAEFAVLKQTLRFPLSLAINICCVPTTCQGTI